MGHLKQAPRAETYADSFRRPRARRRANTWRPFLVAIRARKPWVRFRFRTLGWNVRFMALTYLQVVLKLKRMRLGG